MNLSPIFGRRRTSEFVWHPVSVGRHAERSPAISARCDGAIDAIDTGHQIMSVLAKLRTSPLMRVSSPAGRCFSNPRQYVDWKDDRVTVCAESNDSAAEHCADIVRIDPRIASAPVGAPDTQWRSVYPDIAGAPAAVLSAQRAIETYVSVGACS